MADVHSRAVRSYNMSRIKGKDTKPEILVRKFLFSRGLRFRLHDKKLPGKPDIVLPRYRTAIFVHGCFWHSHQDCKYFVVPKSNTDFWLKKLETNRTNDTRNQKMLMDQGWNVITIFECQLKTQKKLETLNELSSQFH
jgi:DNA mismatch endonuclease, patch repair protein